MWTRDEFDEWAERYDQKIADEAGQFPFDGYYDVLAMVQRLAGVGEGSYVLDVGIGTGLLSVGLYEAGCNVCGIDFAPKMIATARAKMPEAEFDVVDIAHDRFGKFNEGRFDAIIAGYFLHHLNDDQKVELIEVALANNLTAGGKIVIGDIGYATRAEFDAAHQRHRERWDEEEFYFCGEEMVPRLARRGIVASWGQVSSCAGVLLVQSM